MGNICVLFSDLRCCSQSIPCAGVAAFTFSVTLLWKSSVQNNVQTLRPLWLLMTFPSQSVSEKFSKYPRYLTWNLRVGTSQPVSQFFLVAFYVRVITLYYCWHPLLLYSSFSFNLRLCKPLEVQDTRAVPEVCVLIFYLNVYWNHLKLQVISFKVRHKITRSRG
jgi:hypothetical protein